jgi:hypothetical protein
MPSLSHNPGALELYQSFLNDYNKFVAPAARRHLIYSGGHHFIQTGSYIQLLERDELFLSIIASMLCRRRLLDTRAALLETKVNALENAVVDLEHKYAMLAAMKKSVRFSGVN